MAAEAYAASLIAMVVFLFITVTASAQTATPSQQGGVGPEGGNTKLLQVSALELAQRARRFAANHNYSDAIETTGQALQLAYRGYGKDHIYTAYILDDLATYHFELGRLTEALDYSGQALQIATKQLAPDTTELASLLSNKATIVSGLGRYRQAEALYRNAYDVFLMRLGAKHERTLRTARHLGITYLELSRNDEAKDFLLKAIAAAEVVYDSENIAVARLQLDIADVHLKLENVPQARAAADKARGIVTAQPSADIVDVGSVQVMLARIDIQQSKLSAAEQRLRSMLDQVEAAGKGQELVAASLLYNLGFIDVLRGNAVEAEPVYRQVLDIYRELLGPRHPAVGRVMHSMAMVYGNLGQYADADQLFRSAIDLFEENFGPIDASVAATRLERGLLLSNPQRPGETMEDAYKRVDEAVSEARTSLSIYQQLPGSWDIKIAYASSSLGFALHAKGDLTAAEKSFVNATQLMTELRGEDSSDLPPGLTQLGEIYWKQGRLKEAETSLQRAIAILEKDQALTPHGLANSLAVLAKVRLAQQRYEDALAVARRYVGVMDERLGVAQRSYSVAALGEQRKSRYLYEEYLDIAQTVRARLSEPRESLSAEMFKIAQYPHLTDTAAAISRMAARFVPERKALANLAREQQETLQQWRAVNAILNQKLAEGASNQGEQDRLRRELVALDKKLPELDAQLRKDFPGYAELINPLPVPLENVQQVLDTDEALLLQVTGKLSTHVFLVRHGKLVAKSTQMNAAQLEKAVKSLRDGLDIQHHPFEDLPPFDTESAYLLYRNIVGPFTRYLSGVKHIVLVADGALQNLPPSVLLASPADRQPKHPGDFRRLDFLGKHYAFSVVPSVSAFWTLRLNKDPTRTAQPFVGFGDPELTEISLQGFQGKIDLLPETAQELQTMAELLGAGDDVLYLHERANEATVKRIDLSVYRTVAFATHALMTGEFGDLAEPALLLTPPNQLDNENDGFLTASEVARLNLNADWVVLSACNTASPEGRPGAEGLSGLAKAFFYAGSRSLLVSHWWVDSESTVLLTTGTLKAMRKNRTLRRAEALQSSMLTLMNSEVDPYYAHPVFWAPFVLVGEGGSIRI